MNTLKCWNARATVAAGLVALTGLVNFAVAATDANSPAGEAPSIPGMTAEDMQKFAAASTPGEMHKFLQKDVGNWRCKTTMWMSPDSEPMTSEGTSTAKSLMDGRFTQVEMNGEMPGMGPYHGIGIYGYDNVSKQFVSTWIDNMGTGMMNGVGELSDDGKTLTWEFTGNCPVAGKQITMREVETTTGPNTKTLEMFGTPPHGGDEYKMMSIELTRE
jgi:hypothetical protein